MSGVSDSASANGGTDADAAGVGAWDIVGHEQAVAELRSAIARGRLSHSYLFSGPPSVGKAALAVRLAQALLCEAGAEEAPCLQCRICRQVEAGEAPDVERIAVGGVCDQSSHGDHATDGASRIRICQVRRLERVASLTPFQAARRIFILDTADELQPEAAHALLKTLEEPPPAVLIVLLAADVEALLPTIRSRCQQLRLRPAPLVELAAALERRLEITAEEAGDLARLAGGRYGLAQRLHTDPSLRVLRETAAADVRRLNRADRNERFDYAAQLARSWRGERESVLATLDVWRRWWRDVLLAAAGLDRVTDDGADEAAAAETQEEATLCSPAQALRALQATQRAREHMIENTNPQLALEVMMLDLPLLPAAVAEPEGEEARQAVAR